MSYSIYLFRTLVGCVAVLLLAGTALAANGHIYWTEGGRILRSNLDGSNVTPLVTGLARRPII